MAEIKSIAVLEEGSHFRAVNDVTGKPFGPEMVIKNGQVTAVGKTISTKPKNLLGKKEGTKFVISGKQYVIKDIKQYGSRQDRNKMEPRRNYFGI